MAKTSYDYKAANREDIGGRKSPKKRGDARSDAFSHEKLEEFRGRRKKEDDEQKKMRNYARRRDTA